MKSEAKTVPALLAALPPERRDVLAAVRKVILANLPKGYVETVNYGMIAYELPLERYPDTYNGQPLAYAALAAQKNYYALYIGCGYGYPEQEVWIRKAFADAGKKLDMGKSCIRFKKLEDLPLDVVAKAVGMLTPEEFIAGYESVKADPTGRRAKKTKASGASAAKPTRRRSKS